MAVKTTAMLSILWYCKKHSRLVTRAVWIPKIESFEGK